MTQTLNYRTLFDFFLRDESLTKAQRAIGLVLILRTSINKGFIGPLKGMQFDRVATLSGYEEAEARDAFEALSAAGWFSRVSLASGTETYRITAEKREAARVWRQAKEEARVAATEDGLRSLA